MAKQSGSWGKAVYLAVCFASVGLLGFIAGSIATLSEVAPARVVENAYRAGSALYSKLMQLGENVDRVQCGDRPGPRSGEPRSRSAS